ncbi:MAG: 16S rRNA (cytidine(1402)-2'-O)-methyltransferase [Pseudomonadales bacterium]|nr:16S rRNA (cytidine(1402)-2'-O)-methyltransferase [Pseudomonadales bacterium]
MGINVSELYIVATPIGNLADMTERAIQVLSSVDLIAAEDTRHSKRLLQHFSIGTPMLAYHEHGGEQQTEKLLKMLQEGKSIALISDAGTPLISDPGYRIVHEAHARGLKVVPIPGACALISALCAAGLPTNKFAFEGFLPAKQKARCDVLSAVKEDSRTLVFYEAPHRIEDTLKDMCEIFGGERKITLARELTKTFETIKQEPLAQMLEWVSQDSNQRRGEIVLVLEACVTEKVTDLDERSIALLEVLAKELPPKKASKMVAEHYGIPKKTAYEYLLSLKN